MHQHRRWAARCATTVALLLSFFGGAPHAAAEDIVKIKSYNYPSLVWRASGQNAVIGDDVAPENNANWKMVQGLANAGSDYVSFESVSQPGYYLRQSNSILLLALLDPSIDFAADATFKKLPGLKDPTWTSFQSYRYPQKYIRHYKNLRLDNVTTDTQMQDATFKTVVDDCGGIGASGEDIAALQSCTGNPATCAVGGNDNTI